MKTSAHMQYGIVEKSGWEPSPSGDRDHPHGNFTMKRLQVLPLLIGLFFAFGAGVGNAQSVGDKADASLTREAVKMERDEFYKTHQYDPKTDNWVLKPGYEPPAGKKSRAEVKAERDEFYKTHKYDPKTDIWVTLTTPRDTSKLTREQVRAETAHFYRTHSYDPVNDTWVEKGPGKKK